MTGAALRRALHASTAVVTLMVLVSPRALQVTTLFVAGAAILFEVVRLRSSWWRMRIAKLVPVYRDTEVTKPSGAMWLACGYAVASWLPGNAAVAGILAGAFADPTAATVGTRWGGPAPKSWVGTVSAVLVIAVVTVVSGYTLVAALVASLVGASLERWSAPVDDNLVVAPGVAVVLAALT